MDAATIAVNLVQNQAALQKLDVSAKLVKQQEESKQGLIDLIVATAEGASVYGSGGNLGSLQTGSILDRRV
jgi:hypothetical protein